jgi:hypothetical protein
MIDYESIHFRSAGRKTTTASSPEVLGRLKSIVGENRVILDPQRVELYGYMP